MADTTNTYSSLTNEQKTYFERKLLSRLLPNLVFAKYGQKKSMPKNEGDKINFRRFNSLAAATTPLTEGVTPDGAALDITKVEAQVAQLTKERDAATQRADVSDKKLSDIKAYVAGV